MLKHLNAQLLTSL